MTLYLGIVVDPRNSVFVFEKKKLRAALRAAGGEVAALTRKALRKSAGGGRVYRGSGGSRYRPYKAGRYQASAAGQAPVNVTATLLGSVKVGVAGSGQSVRISEAFYGLFLEKGAKGGGKGGRVVRQLLPRPHLTAALEQREASISERIRAAVVDGIAFKRMKP